jgi:uncharacterized membrane protein
MMRRIVIIVSFLITAAIVVGCYCFGKSIPMSQQWPLYEALRTTASIIFAVVGAWLAIIYPERLRMSLRNDGGGSETGGSRIGVLLFPAVHSTCILCVILISGLALPLLKQVGYLQMHFPTT